MKVKIFTRQLTLSTAALLAFSCHKKSDDGATENTSVIILSGKLALTGQTTGLRLTDPAITDLSVYCVTLAVPPVAGTGSVASDGKFALTIASSGAAVGCFVLDAEKTVLGTMVFKDNTKKDLNGDAKSADRFALDGGASDLGSITFNLSTGKAEVDVAQVVGKKKNTTAALVDAYDFSGNYQFVDSGFAAPEGYSNLCSAAEAAAEEGRPDDGTKKCNGPSIDMPINFKRIKGVVPGSTTPAYAMAFWQSKAMDTLCGNKLGFTYAEGISRGIDFTNSGVGSGDFIWDPTLVDGWKDIADARVSSSITDQVNVTDFKGFAGNKQYFVQYRTKTCNPGQPCSDSAPIVAAGFQFNANNNESGCRNASGKSVKIDSWQDMSCTNTELTGVSAGLFKNTCTKTVDNSLVTCTSVGGTFLSNGTPLPQAYSRYPDDYHIIAQGPYCDYNSNGHFDANEDSHWDGNAASCDNHVAVTLGALCSSLNVSTDAGLLVQQRCYAESYNNTKGDDDNSCRRELRTNWNATTASDFVGKVSKPKSQFVFSLLDYDTATSASLRGEDTDYRGIKAGDSFTSCEIHSVFSFSMKKIDGSTDLYAEMVQSDVNVSPKPACVAEFPAAKPTKYMFKLKKLAD